MRYDIYHPQIVKKIIDLNIEHGYIGTGAKKTGNSVEKIQVFVIITEIIYIYLAWANARNPIGARGAPAGGFRGASPRTPFFDRKLCLIRRFS